MAPEAVLSIVKGIWTNGVKYILLYKCKSGCYCSPELAFLNWKDMYYISVHCVQLCCVFVLFCGQCSLSCIHIIATMGRNYVKMPKNGKCKFQVMAWKVLAILVMDKTLKVASISFF